MSLDLSPAEICIVNSIMNGAADLLDFQDLYEKLFSYFCLSGRMPYGVAKARTGDPYEWISDHLEEVL